MVLPLLLALCIHAARADEPAPPSVARSVQLLSRYAPGDLPASPSVLSALAALGEQGQADVVPLLNSIVEEEDGGLALLAGAALEQVDARARAAEREAYRAHLPRRDALLAWLVDAPDRAHRTDGGSLGRREGLTVAYAAVILGEATPGGPQVLELVEAEEARALLARGTASEQDRNFQGAVLHYAQAMASGSAEGGAHLERLGIDPTRLLLGMTADTVTGAAVVLPPIAMEALVAAPGRDAVSVLLDRAEHGRPLTRVVALSALGQLAEASLMTPREHAAARRALAAAVRAPEPFVREVALTTLTDLPEP